MTEPSTIPQGQILLLKFFLMDSFPSWMVEWMDR